MTTDQDVFSLWKQHSEAIGRFVSFIAQNRYHAIASCCMINFSIDVRMSYIYLYTICPCRSIISVEHHSQVDRK
jgi:hypothetical protein